MNRPHLGEAGTRRRTQGTDRKSRRRRRRSIGAVTTVTSGLVAFTTGLPEHRRDPTGTTGGPEGEARPTHTTGVNTGSLFLVYTLYTHRDYALLRCTLCRNLVHGCVRLRLTKQFSCKCSKVTRVVDLVILRFYVLATGVVGALPGLRPVKVLPQGEVPEAKGPRPALHPTRPHSQEAGVLHELQRGHLHPNKTGLPGTVAWVTI